MTQPTFVIHGAHTAKLLALPGKKREKFLDFSNAEFTMTIRG